MLVILPYHLVFAWPWLEKYWDVYKNGVIVNKCKSIFDVSHLPSLFDAGRWQITKYAYCACSEKLSTTINNESDLFSWDMEKSKCVSWVEESVLEEKDKWPDWSWWYLWFWNDAYLWELRSWLACWHRDKVNWDYVFEKPSWKILCIKDMRLYSYKLNEKKWWGFFSFMEDIMIAIKIFFRHIENLVLFLLTALTKLTTFGVVAFDKLPDINYNSFKDAFDKSTALWRLNLWFLPFIAFSIIVFSFKKVAWRWEDDWYTSFFIMISVILSIILWFPYFYSWLNTFLDISQQWLAETFWSEGWMAEHWIKLSDFANEPVYSLTFSTLIFFFANMILLFVSSVIIVVRNILISILAYLFIPFSFGLIVQTFMGKSVNTPWNYVAKWTRVFLVWFYYTISFLLVSVLVILMIQFVNSFLSNVPSMSAFDGGQSMLSNITNYWIDTFMCLLFYVTIMILSYWKLTWKISDFVEYVFRSFVLRYNSNILTQVDPLSVATTAYDKIKNQRQQDEKENPWKHDWTVSKDENVQDSFEKARAEDFNPEVDTITDEQRKKREYTKVRFEVPYKTFNGWAESESEERPFIYDENWEKKYYGKSEKRKKDDYVKFSMDIPMPLNDHEQGASEIEKLKNSWKVIDYETIRSDGNINEPLTEKELELRKMHLEEQMALNLALLESIDLNMEELLNEYKKDPEDEDQIDDIVSIEDEEKLDDYKIQRENIEWENDKIAASLDDLNKLIAWQSTPELLKETNYVSQETKQTDEGLEEPSSRDFLKDPIIIPSGLKNVSDIPQEIKIPPSLKQETIVEWELEEVIEDAVITSDTESNEKKYEKVENLDKKEITIPEKLKKSTSKAESKIIKPKGKNKTKSSPPFKKQRKTINKDRFIDNYWKQDIDDFKQKYKEYSKSKDPDNLHSFWDNKIIWKLLEDKFAKTWDISWIWDDIRKLFKEM